MQREFFEFEWLGQKDPKIAIFHNTMMNDVVMRTASPFPLLF